jgi:hypothetical protein
VGDSELVTTGCITALAQDCHHVLIKRAHKFVHLAKDGFVLTDLPFAILEHSSTITVSGCRQTGADVPRV